MTHLISIHDLSKSHILEYLDLATALEKKSESYFLKNKLIATAFFEPSTRTRLSFEAAALKLGAKTIGFTDERATSIAKGESLSDTIKILAGYADAIVIRHPKEGAARFAAEIADIPVINAGDGANQHPSQTLLDFFTLQKAFTKLEGLHLALVGDLKYSRTIHSLVEAASLFDMRLYFVAAQQLSLPATLMDLLKRRGVKYSFHQHLDEMINHIDVLYLTRLQIERFNNENIAEYIPLNLDLLQKAKPHLKILHPLPRQNELPVEIDSTPHALYFQQAKNGVIMRQAILLKSLGYTNV